MRRGGPDFWTGCGKPRLPPERVTRALGGEVDAAGLNAEHELGSLGMAIGTLDAVLYVVQTRNESENADLSECEGSESESECSSSSSECDD